MLILGFARDVQNPTPLLCASLPFCIAALAGGPGVDDTASLFKCSGVAREIPSPARRINRERDELRARALQSAAAQRVAASHKMSKAWGNNS
jgi:hypothetical protein